ncbi:MAG: helix-turn-helix transcriptional regulator [Coriobacteriia bacterium]|nr:helix-turn-helix transcriptional regulator [Coriobacteriia bacterium]
MTTRLRQVRKARGWSQLRLAAKSGVPPAHISQAETGRRIPYPCEAERLCAALDYQVLPSDLMEVSDD